LLARPRLDHPAMSAANDDDPYLAAREIELDRTLDAIARELPPLTIHQKIILAREIEAFADRLPSPRYPDNW
jgi:hypothetical protein